MIRHLGFVAARRGEPTSANPYRTYLERIAWIGGYSEGRVSQAFGTMLASCDTASKR
ncbi:ribosome modulation factor [Sphingobium yanoikuyae]